jgi:hypothetical protein
MLGATEAVALQFPSPLKSLPDQVSPTVSY